MNYVYLLLKVNLKILSRKKVLMVLIILAPLVSLMFAQTIFTSAAFFDKVPIALIDEDNSVTSQRIMASISNSTSLKCKIINKKDIVKTLNDNVIQGVYILNSGLEEKLKKQEFDNLITVHYLPDNLFAIGITDVIASKLSYYVCGNKAANIGQQVIGKNNSVRIYDDIIDYNLSRINDPEFKLPLNVKSLSPGSKIENTALLKGNVVSKQFALGMVIIFTTLFLLPGCSSIMKTRASGVYKRIQAAGVNKSYLFLSDLISIMLSGIFVFSLQLFLLSRVMEIGFKSFAFVIISCVIYMFCISNLFILSTRVFKNYINLQNIMPVIILFMGLLGGCLWSVELMPKSILIVAHLMPTYWLHQALTSLILYNGNVNDILLGLVVLVGYGIGFMIINFIRA